MTEKLHQSLSSVMDGAGDDLELPRLLSAMQASSEVSQELSEKWRRYHLAQGILRGELRSLKHPQVAQMDISAAIMERLEQEEQVYTDAGAASDLGFFQKEATSGYAVTPAPAAASPTSEKRLDRGQWFRGSALAASVALLVITGVQIFNTGNEPGAIAPVSVAVQPESIQPLTVPVSYSSNFSTQPPRAFSGFSVVNFSADNTRQQPCEAEKDTYLPLLSPQAVQQVNSSR